MLSLKVQRLRFFSSLSNILAIGLLLINVFGPAKGIAQSPTCSDKDLDCWLNATTAAPRNWGLRDQAKAAIQRLAENDPKLQERLARAFIEGVPKDLNSFAFDVLYDLGPKAKAALPILINAPQSSVSRERRSRNAVLIAMSKESPTERKKIFDRAFSDQDAFVRQETIQAVGKLGQDGASFIPKLVEVLQTPATAGIDIQIKRYAIESLGKVGAPAKTTIPVLMSLLKKNEGGDNLQLGVVQGLAQFEQEGAAAALPVLEQRLKDPNPTVRLSGANAIGMFKTNGKGAQQALIAAANDSDERVQKAVQSALRSIGVGSAQAVESLTASATSGDVSERLHAIRALGNLGYRGDNHPNPTPVLISLLSDPERLIRIAAAEAISKVGPAAQDATPKLIQMLQDSDPEIKAAGAKGLERMHTVDQEAIDAITKAITDTNPAVRLSLVGALGDSMLSYRKKDQLVAVLVPLLSDPDRLVRLTAAKGLRFSGEAGGQASSALSALLTQNDPEIKQAAAEALANIGSKQTGNTSAITSVFGTADVNVRRKAAEELGEEIAFGKGNLDALKTALNDPDPQVRINVMSGCCSQLQPEVAQLFIETLKDSDPRVREKAASSLAYAQTSKSQVVPALIEALNANPTILSAISSLREYEQDTKPAIPRLTELLSDPRTSDQTKKEIAETLQYIGANDPQTNKALQSLTQNPNQELKNAALRALGSDASASSETIERHLISLKDANSQTRTAAIEALGNLGQGASSTIPALVTALDDEVAWVRQRASYAIGEIKGDESKTAELLSSVLIHSKKPETRLAAAEALQEMKSGTPASKSALQIALKDTDAKVRASALVGLQEIGKSAADALPAVIDCLDDPDPRVRERAAAAISRIGSTDEANQKLQKLLKDPDPGVKSAATYALHPMFNRALKPDTRSDLVNARDKQLPSPVRYSAISNLGRSTTETKERVIVLTEVLKDSDLFLASAAARSLGEIGKDAVSAVPALTELLDKQDQSATCAAAKALSQIKEGTSTAIPILKTLALTSEDYTRTCTAQALSVIAPDDSTVEKALLSELQSPEKKKRLFAMKALAKSSSESIRSQLLPLLTESLNSNDDEVVRAALQGLMHYGPKAKDAVPQLTKFLDTKEFLPAAVAALCLIGKDAESATPAIIKALKELLSKGERSNSGGYFGAQMHGGMYTGTILSINSPEKASQIFGDLAKDSSSEIRKLSVMALPCLAQSKPDSQNILEQLATSDSDENVRKTAQLVRQNSNKMTDFERSPMCNCQMGALFMR